MSDSGVVPAALLRRLTTENMRMAKRLAQYELRAFLEELENPRIFELEIDLQDRPRPPSPVVTADPDDPLTRRLPRIAVPLGKCAMVEAPDSLPVVGIYCPEMPDEALRAALTDMIRSHSHKPFARLVFLCKSLRPIPLLGRYGYAYDYISDFPLAGLAPRLAMRYGLIEVRDLATAVRVWPE